MAEVFDYDNIFDEIKQNVEKGLKKKLSDIDYEKIIKESLKHFNLSMDDIDWDSKSFQLALGRGLYDALNGTKKQLKADFSNFDIADYMRMDSKSLIGSINESFREMRKTLKEEGEEAAQEYQESFFKKMTLAMSRKIKLPDKVVDTWRDAYDDLLNDFDVKLGGSEKNGDDVFEGVTNIEKMVGADLDAKYSARAKQFQTLQIAIQEKIDDYKESVEIAKNVIDTLKKSLPRGVSADEVHDILTDALTKHSKQQPIVESVTNATDSYLPKLKQTGEKISEAVKQGMQESFSDDDMDAYLAQMDAKIASSLDLSAKEPATDMSDMGEEVVESVKKSKKAVKELKQEMKEVVTPQVENQIVAQSEEQTKNLQKMTSAEKEMVAVHEEITESAQEVNNLQEETEAIQKESKALETLADKFEYLKKIKAESKFMEDAEEKRIDMEEKAWDVGGNNPKSEAESQKRIQKYEELCEHIEQATHALDEFNETYEKVVVSLKNGERVEILDAADLDNIKLAKQSIKDIQFILQNEDSVSNVNEEAMAFKNVTSELDNVKQHLVDLKKEYNVLYEKASQPNGSTIMSKDEVKRYFALEETISETEGKIRRLQSHIKNEGEIQDSLNLKVQDEAEIQDNIGRIIDSNNAKILEGTKLIEQQSGKLRVLYHGSNADFDKFDISKFSDNAMYGKGAYFTFNKTDAETYGYQISEWFANINKIYSDNVRFSEEELTKIFNEYKSDIEQIWNNIDLDTFLNKMFGKTSSEQLDFLANNVTGLSEGDLLKKMGYQGRYLDLEHGQGLVVFDVDNIVKAKTILAEGTTTFNTLNKAEVEMGEQGEAATEKIKEGLQEVQKETNKALELFKESKGMNISGMLDAGWWATPEEAAAELGEKYQKLLYDDNDKRSAWNETLLNQEYFRDILPYLDLTAEQLDVIKTELYAIDKYKPGGDWERLSTTQSPYLDGGKRIDNITAIATGTRNITKEELKDAQSLAKAMQEVGTELDNLGREVKISGRQESIVIAEQQLAEETAKANSVIEEQKQKITELEAKQEELYNDIAARENALLHTVDEDDYDAAVTNLETQKTITQELQKQNKELQERNDLLKEESDSYRSEADSLQTELNRSLGSAGYLDEELNKQKQITEELRQQNTQLQEQNEEHQKKIDAMHEEMEDDQRHYTFVDEELGRQKELNDTLMASVEAERQARKEAEGRASFYEDMSNIAAREEARAKERADQEFEAREEAEKTLKETERQAKALQEQNDVLNTSLALAKQVANEYQEQFDKMRLLKQTAGKTNKNAEQEARSFDHLRESVEGVTKAVNDKTDAFKNEQSVVKGAVGDEVNVVGQLKGAVDDVKAVNKAKQTKKTKQAKDENAANVKQAVQYYNRLIKNERQFQSLAAKRGIGIELSKTESKTLSNLQEQRETENEILSIVKERTKELEKARTTYEETRLLAQQEAQVLLGKELRTSITSVRDKLQSKIDSGKYSPESVGVVQQSLDALSQKNYFDETNTQKLKEYLDTLKGIDTQFEKIGNKTKLTKLLGDVSSTLADNTKMSKDLRGQFDSLNASLQEALNTGASQEQVRALTNRFLELKNEMIKTGQTGRSFFGMIKNDISQASARMIAQYMSFQDFIRYIRAAASAVTDLNSALNQLRIVSGESEASVNRVGREAYELANNLGMSTTEVVSSITEWRRLGKTIDESMILAEQAARLSTGGMMDISSATTALVSSMQAFEMKAEDINKVVDQYIYLGK